MSRGAETLKKYAEFTIAVVTAGTLLWTTASNLVAFISGRGPKLPFAVATLAALLLAVVLTHLSCKKTAVGVGFEPKNRRWLLPNALRVLMIGTAVISVLVGAYGMYRLIQQTSPDHVLILVARFNGPESDSFRVSDVVSYEIRKAVADLPNVHVDNLQEGFGETDGSNAAVTAGQRRNADVVVWGWYGKTPTDALVTVHFEILHPECCLETNSMEESLHTSVAELNSFRLQSRLSTDIALVARFASGVTHYRIDQFDAAIKDFDTVLARIGHGSTMDILNDVLLYRGMAHFHQAELQPAIQDFTSVIERDPTIAAAYLDRGDALRQNGRFEPSIDDATTYIRLQPNEPDGYLNRGLSYAAIGAYDKAIADETSALQRSVDPYPALINRAMIHRRNREFALALSDTNAAIRIHRLRGEGYLNRANIKTQVDDLDGAMFDALRAALLSDGDPRPLMVMGLIAVKSNDIETGAHVLTQMKKVLPDAVETQMLTAVLALQSGNSRDCISAVSKAIDLRERDPQLYAMRGACEAEDRIPDAIRDFDTAIQLAPQIGEFYAMRGLLRMSNTRSHDSALQDLEAAQRLGISSMTRTKVEAAIAELSKPLQGVTARASKQPRARGRE